MDNANLCKRVGFGSYVGVVQVTRLRDIYVDFYMDGTV
jgi:hypothetical protein